MQKRSNELYFALTTALLIGVVYLGVAQNGVPRSSGFAGHGIGIAGFILMLGAETAYSWRKQRRGARWGSMRLWLQVHIFIGLVGPFLVLLHSAWRLNGLAGLAMLLTMLMVASGFVCSYIYTAVPRTVDGAELAMRDLEAQIAATNMQLQGWTAGHPAVVATLAGQLTALTKPTQSGGAGTVWGRTFLHWGYQRQLRRELKRLDATSQVQARELANLLDQHYRLDTQAHSLAAARKLLGQSRSFHIVLGVVLFVFAFIHIGAALYYATLAH